jgi:hypothetical protein
MTSASYQKIRQQLYISSPIERPRSNRGEMDVIRVALYDVLVDDNPMPARQVFYRLVSSGAIAKTEMEHKQTIVRLLTEMRRDREIPFTLDRRQFNQIVAAGIMRFGLRRQRPACLLSTTGACRNGPKRSNISVIKLGLATRARVLIGASQLARCLVFNPVRSCLDVSHKDRDDPTIV